MGRGSRLQPGTVVNGFIPEHACPFEQVIQRRAACNSYDMRKMAGVVRFRDIERIRQMVEDNSLFELFPKSEVIPWILRAYSFAYNRGVHDGIAISRQLKRQGEGSSFEATRKDSHVKRFHKERLRFLKKLAPDLLWEEESLPDLAEFTEEEMELVLEKGL